MGLSRILVQVLAGLLILRTTAQAAPQPPQPIGGWESHGPAYPNVLDLAIAPDDERKLYAAAWDPGTGASAIFVSTDAGLSWSTLAPALPGEIIRKIAVDPGVPSRLAAVTTGSPSGVHVYRSSDGGYTWFLAFLFSSLTRDGTVFFDTSGNGTVYLHWNGVYEGKLGPLWEKADPIQYFWGASHPMYRLEIFDLWPAPDGLVLWTTQEYFYGDLIIQGSPVDSLNEFTEAPCLGMTPVAYSAADPNLAYAGAHGCGTVLKSTDGGKNWSPTSLTGITADDVLVGPGTSPIVYVRAGAQLFQSADGGDTWTTLPLPAPAVTQLLLAASGRTLYAATGEGVFQRSLSRTRIVPRGSP